MRDQQNFHLENLDLDFISKEYSWDILVCTLHDKITWPISEDIVH